MACSKREPPNIAPSALEYEAIRMPITTTYLFHDVIKKTSKGSKFDAPSAHSGILKATEIRYKPFALKTSALHQNHNQIDAATGEYGPEGTCAFVNYWYNAQQLYEPVGMLFAGFYEQSR